MLDINGAVEAEWPDEGVAAHYGDPAREQRAMTEGQVLVDRSNRGVVKVTGQDRLSWLHSLTSQHLERLAPGSTEEALILFPQGHLEHHLTLTDDGTPPGSTSSRTPPRPSSTTSTPCASCCGWRSRT